MRDHADRPGRRRRRRRRCARPPASSSRPARQASEVDALGRPSAGGCRPRPGGRRRRRPRRARGRCGTRSAGSTRYAACVGVPDDGRGPAGARTRAPPRRRARAARRSSMPSTTTSVTSGSPLVRVPVLSITTVSIRAEVSRAVAFLNSTPRWAPSPVPTMIAVGVARPSASGQVMTTTVIANSSAVVHRPRRPPARPAKVHRAADQRDQHQPERRPVGQPLPGCLGVLRLLHQRHDLRQRGVRADLGGAHPQRAGGVDDGADHRGAGRLVHRQALAGDHRLVDLGLAVLDDAVDGDLGAGPDQQQVADDDLGGGDLDRLARRGAPRPVGGARSSRVRMASLAPPRARISNQCPSSTNAVSTVAAS